MFLPALHRSAAELQDVAKALSANRQERIEGLMDEATLCELLELLKASLESGHQTLSSSQDQELASLLRSRSRLGQLVSARMTKVKKPYAPLSAVTTFVGCRE